MSTDPDHKLHFNHQECISKAKEIVNDTLREEYLKALRVLKHHKFLIEVVDINMVTHMYPDQFERYVVGITDDKFERDLEAFKMPFDPSSKPENFVDIEFDASDLEPIETDPNRLIRFKCQYDEWVFDAVLWNDIYGFYLTVGPFDGPAYRNFAVNFYYTLYDYEESKTNYLWMNYYLNLK